jgi:iron complex outermembrane receptor protein
MQTLVRGAALVTLMCGVSHTALAQTAPAGPTAVEEIVVTGTLIRGVAPIGSAVSTVGAEDIQRQGVTQSNQLLAAIPQMAGFNGVPRTSTANQGVTGYRPNLRSLPPLQNGTTLIMVDSHNLVGGSVQQNFPDISALPTGAIERVEVVLDGGSATYGSDAVGGVLNFITRTRYDGVRVTGNVGTAPGTSYRTYNFGVLAGREWAGGSVVFDLETRQNNPLFANEREFPRQDLRDYGGSDFRVRTCSPGNIIIGATTYALPGRAPGSLNLCDTSQAGVINGSERQTSGYVSFSQQLSDSVDFRLTAFGTDRLTRSPTVQLSNSGAVINSTNPFFRPIGTEAQHTVAFSWESVLGPYASSSLKMTQVDVSPSITWRINDNWQLKALADYGRSEFDQFAGQINTAAETAALRGAGLTTTTALNPYDLTQTNAAVLRAITDYGTFNHVVQSLATVRAIADGPIFTLPGGEVRLAVGAQFQRVKKDDYAIMGPSNTVTRAADTRRKRDISAVFAELVVPLIGDGNALPLVQELNLDVSTRYNDYEVIGATTDPKIGVDWKIVDGLKVRANWGTAFVAPGLNDTTLGGIDSVVIVAATSGTLRPTDPTTDRNRPTITVQGGGRAGIKPVTAENWSFGADFNPSFLPNLSTSLTYWSVEMKDLIQPGCTSLTTAQQLADPSLEGTCYFYRPSLSQSLALAQGINIYSGSSTSVTALYGAGNDPYLLVDGRKRNLGGYNTSGLDFRIAYRQPLDWGTVYGSISGTKYLKRETQALPTSPFINTLDSDFSKLTLQGVIGADIGPFTATATVNYVSGYTLTGVVNQTELDSYQPVNLFFRYNMDQDLMFTVNVDNAFDEDPPFVNRSGGIVGSTLGRFVSFGVQKRF